MSGFCWLPVRRADQNHGARPPTPVVRQERSEAWVDGPRYRAFDALGLSQHNTPGWLWRTARSGGMLFDL
jgi:hypothetical protein